MELTLTIDDEKLKAEAERVALQMLKDNAYASMVDTIKGLPNGLTTNWHDMVQSTIYEAFKEAFLEWFTYEKKDGLAKAVALELLDSEIFTLRLIKHLGKQ